MKRNQGRWSILLTALIVASTPEGTSNARSGAASSGAAPVESVGGCPLGVVGVWKPETTTETSPIFLSFSADGWVSLLGGAAETRAQDFEVLAQVGYKVDASRTATRIEFRTARGTDVFPPGTTSWEIVHYGDEGFTRVDRQSGEQSRWVRVQTHRYFLTLAARDENGGPAVAMWTKLDGRKADFDALGVRPVRSNGGDATSVFGRIPQALAREFTVESGNELDVMMRLELSEAEYHRTHRLFEAWEQRVRERSLPADDPYRRTLQLLEGVTQSLNQCGDTIEPKTVDLSTLADSGRETDARRQLAGFIRLMRKMNYTRHVPDDVFPFTWEPPPPM